MKPLIVGNWKMNLLTAEARALADAVVRGAATISGAEVVLCPPAPLLVPVAACLAGTTVELGAQDCHQDGSGAHTGDTSARLLRDVGCSHVIVGHSERRADHREPDSLVAAKCAAAHTAGLRVIVCVGETEGDRQEGRALKTVEAQLRTSLPPGGRAGNTIIAYEPVWAIGTGKTATAGDIAEMHHHIGSVLAGTGERLRGARVLYGGSVKPENAREVLSVPGVDGALVGGASLVAGDFLAIVRSAEE